MSWRRLLTWLGALLGALAVVALVLLSTLERPAESAKVNAPAPLPPVVASVPPPPIKAAPPPPPIKALPPKIYAPSEVPPSASVKPKAVPPGGITHLPPWPDARRESAFTQLAQASLAFNVDNKFNVKQTGQAKVVIDFSKTVDALKAQLAKEGKPGSITGGADIGVSKVVIANIVAPGLSVTAITPTEQVVLTTEPTTWLWDLRASEPGTYHVRITLTASIVVDGRATNRFLRVHDEVVTIEIRPEQRVADLIKQHWQWAFSSLLVPLGVWLWKRRQKKADQ